MFSFPTPTWIILPASIACFGSACTVPRRCIWPVRPVYQVEHKLRAYNWNLLDAESFDFRLTAAEFDADRIGRVGEFRAREAFQRRELSSSALPPRTLLEEDEFRIESVLA
jgi:ribonuclease Z